MSSDSDNTAEDISDLISEHFGNVGCAAVVMRMPRCAVCGDSEVEGYVCPKFTLNPRDNERVWMCLGHLYDANELIKKVSNY